MTQVASIHNLVSRYSMRRFPDPLTIQKLERLRTRIEYSLEEYKKLAPTTRIQANLSQAKLIIDDIKSDLELEG